MSKFALLCQAARLLGQVLTYVATEREGETEVEAQLDRTLHSMLKVAMGVKEPDYDQITFIFRYVFSFSMFTQMCILGLFRTLCIYVCMRVIPSLHPCISLDTPSSHAFISFDIPISLPLK